MHIAEKCTCGGEFEFNADRGEWVEYGQKAMNTWRKYHTCTPVAMKQREANRAIAEATKPGAAND